MAIIRHAAAIIIAVGLMPGTGTPRLAPTPDDPPQRVIVQVSRNLEVRGFVELEDDDVIVVRTLANELESFPKSRLLKIVRLVEPEPGQSGVVILSDGQQREGVIIEDTFEYVIIEIKGFRTKLVREAVDHVILKPTFAQRYAQFKAALRPQMPEQHLDLCAWLIKQRKYELARTELLELLQYAQLPEGHRLLTIVNAQLALGQPPGRSEPAKDTDEADGNVDDSEQGGAAPGDALPTQLISTADVNLIRLYEIDFQRPPKVAVSRATIRKLIENYSTSKLMPESPAQRTALFQAEPMEIVQLMFELGAVDLYPEVKVLNEPWGLNHFRRRVHNTWLINTCATSRCHGGAEGGRFFLHRRRYKDERVRYTNLLILDRLELDGEWPLINYDQPAMSLVIQYGLPRHLARKPHPDVRGWKPVFSRPNQRLFQDTIRWIEAMMQPRPEYRIAYDPPGQGPAEDQDPAPAPDRGSG